MKVGDKLYSKKFVCWIESELPDNLYGIVFQSRDGVERSYNIVSPLVIKSMIDHNEWHIGDYDPFAESEQSSGKDQ